MQMRRLSLATSVFLAAAVLSAQQPSPPVLRAFGSDHTIAPESLLGKNARDVRLEDTSGNVTIYHGVPLLEVLEKNGLDLKTMASERQTAADVVLASARDGYTVVFSVGELRLERANPKVFLVAETAAGPLPENQGPVRLIVYGDVARSAYGLARIELKALAENAPAPKKK
ncbi:MAG TPA: molybdopterin-dependent oxidoreductase [Thermoanaerobaculia bacterium]|nr:molybdopterin-dependent oxidoreductase [Thermoanaerobaculia bacterium]